MTLSGKGMYGAVAIGKSASFKPQANWNKAEA